MNAHEEYYHKIFLIFFCLVFLACQNTNKQSDSVDSPEELQKNEQEMPEIADAKFKDGMTAKVFHNYLQLRTALVRSDVEGANEASRIMAEAFKSEREELRSLILLIADAENLEKQREHFFELSKKLEPLFKGNLDSGTIYKLYCPMAFENKGAFWFSEVSEITNPYFGDRMLKCGKVQETIEA